MKEFTRGQILDALQTHKTVQKAAKALGLSYPEMQKYLRRYGIVCNHNAKEIQLTTNFYEEGKKMATNWLEYKKRVEEYFRSFKKGE